MRVAVPLSCAAALAMRGAIAFSPTPAHVARTLPLAESRTFFQSKQNPTNNHLPTSQHRNIIALQSTNDNNNAAADGFFKDIQISTPYALAYILFLVFATYTTQTEAPGMSQIVLDQFLADPIHPTGVNELFVYIFNLLGLIVFPMACLTLPGAKGQKVPAIPFVFGSMFAGFGSLGPYVITKKPVTSMTKSELNWFTRNVLENKLFNWSIIAGSISAFIVTGCADAIITDATGTVRGYWDMMSSSAIASTSTLDLVILTLTAASLIPEDMERRGMVDEGKAKIIAALTLLLPVVGSALYCALRPELPEE